MEDPLLWMGVAAHSTLHTPAHPAREVLSGMGWPDRIVIDPEILAGKPVVRGTRLAVEFVLDLLATGQPVAEVLAKYPGLTHDDICACSLTRASLCRLLKPSGKPVTM
jgi:uncharacterized protein (DUF433 family)